MILDDMEDVVTDPVLGGHTDLDAFTYASATRLIVLDAIDATVNVDASQATPVQTAKKNASPALSEQIVVNSVSVLKE